MSLIDKQDIAVCIFKSDYRKDLPFMVDDDFLLWESDESLFVKAISAMENKVEYIQVPKKEIYANWPTGLVSIPKWQVDLVEKAKLQQG